MLFLNFLFIMILVMIMMMLMCILKSLEMKSEGNLSAFECGFECINSARCSFSFRFFLIAILFLVFDAEIVLMLPIPYINYGSIEGMILLLFVWILVLGLFYEMSFGVLKWTN
uniref:NADH-ubiquinone oxidoreductase chain 3 n=1 Tax=Loxosceles similis TaxID=321804 RepID=A0A4P8VWR1_LOXSM|nr:NADH dehydrogenase subunit 3 [Loxosceles similis]QCS26174.1 NADH dehydrogenase subunit 3 [Loxosceles similis]